jgi:hypothetical protein
VFLHGIGGHRRPEDARRTWTAALAQGMLEGGHGKLSEDLLTGRLVDIEFAYYGDLFHGAQSQGVTASLNEVEAETLRALLLEIVEFHEANTQDPQSRAAFRAARSQLAADGVRQGTGAIVRKLISAATTVLSAAPLRGASQWASGKLLVRDLSQVVRYLNRGEADSEGKTLAARIQDRLLETVAGGPAIVVAHSLGSVVAFEALHKSVNVPVLVTLGSPLAMRVVVWPRLLPQPPTTPESVTTWLNYWDRDDIFSVRPVLEDHIPPNSRGVRARTRRVDSDGVWVHSVTKYLAHGVVGGKVAEAIRTMESLR